MEAGSPAVFRPIAGLLLAFTVGCAGTAPRKPVPPDALALLLDLRHEVESALADRPDADGTLLVREDGMLGLVDPLRVADEKLSPVLDPWGHPVVLLDPTADPSDWCLASAGPDGVWTVDPLDQAGRYEAGAEGYAVHAPDYLGRGDDPRLVIGDDIVVDRLGSAFGRYSFPVPSVDAVVGAVQAVLNGLPSRLPPDAGLARAILPVSPESRARISAFLEVRRPRLTLAEDTWGHDCHRKHGGFVPELFLCEKDLGADFHAISIIPTALGWYLSADVKGLIAAAEPTAEEGTGEYVGDGPAQPPEVPIFECRVHAWAIALCALLPEKPMPQAEAFLRRELVATVAALRPRHQFAVIAFRTRTTEMSDGSWLRPAVPANKKMAALFIRGLDRDDEGFLSQTPKAQAPNGTLRDSLVRALEAVRLYSLNSISAAVVAIGLPGFSAGKEGHRGVAAYLQAVNWSKVPIYAIGLGLEPGGEDEAFLKDIAERNGGTYTATSLPPQDDK